MSYNANYFLLRKHEPLPVQVYSVAIMPKPTLRPQSYQILNIIARRLTNKVRTPTISMGSTIETLGSEIPNGLLRQEASIPGVGKFDVQLTFSDNRQVKPEYFEEYKLLVNRILDTALTVLSPDYYKFHPDAPYIIRDEPYFDPAL